MSRCHRMPPPVFPGRREVSAEVRRRRRDKAVLRRRRLEAERRRQELARRELSCLGGYCGGMLEGVLALSWWAAAKTLEGAMALVRLGVHAVRARQVGRRLASMGVPTPKELSERWRRMGRKTVEEALVLGAMLLRIGATIDPEWRQGADGRIEARGGGMRAWLAEFCPDVPYSTAMRYRKLAERLLALLALEGEWSGWAMECVLPGQPWPEGVARRGETADAVRAARGFVERLLEFHPSQRGLRWVLTRELAAAGAA